ncbi:MAG: ATP-binding cassette domain-containing protein [Bacteroidales bacterium]|nr:ATP-binding cassette domain-containing protein [Bacteroidales bacterium]
MPNNKIHGIVGLNGSGKTSLLNSIFGLKKNDNGLITYQNEKMSKKLISYLVTENFFYQNITGAEYLAIFRNDNFIVEDWDKLFLLPLNEIIDNYSAGMKKKLALIGILKQNKSIIILDEPFNGLDIESVPIVRSVLLKLKLKNRNIIVTSHVFETLKNLCEDSHFLENGKIKQSTNKSEFELLETNILKPSKTKTLI